MEVLKQMLQKDFFFQGEAAADDQKGPFPSNDLYSLIARLRGKSAVLTRDQENDYFQLYSEASFLPLEKKFLFPPFSWSHKPYKMQL